MNITSFEHIVILHFNALIMIIIKGKLNNHKRQLVRRSKREVLFCEIAKKVEDQSS